MKRRAFLHSKAFLALMLALGMLFGTFSDPEAVQAAGTTYYVDSVEGDDGNAGASTGAPWKTLTNVNATTFQPGDQILFKAGSHVTGTLVLQGSGTADNPIVIGQYGTGPKPILDGGGAERVVFLYNVQYVTVRDLEIVNDGAEQALRSGVYIVGQGAGRLHGIHLEQLDIHDIKGLSNLDGVPGRFYNSSIYVQVWDEAGKPLSSFDDLRIENNYIHDVTTSGIYFNGTTAHASQGSAGTYTDWYTGVVVRNNIVKNTGTDGIIVAYSINPLMEHNAVYDAGINDPLTPVNKYISGMWSWGAKDVVWQYNEVARTRAGEKGNTDSMAFDTDIISYGTHIYQYNYSHDNAGGFIMSMGQLKGENIIRYNISQNDGHGHFTDNSIMLNDRSFVYNNVFYNDTGDGFRVGNNANVTYANNVFDTSVDLGYPSNPVFDFNAYHGHAPAAGDLHAVTADPQFILPGSASDGMATTNGYQLAATSPLIGAGKAITDNGGKDYWGNALYNGAPDIGAYEYTGTVPAADTTAPTAPAGLRAVEATDTEIILSWNQAADNETFKPGYEVYDADTGDLVFETAGTTSGKVTGLQAQTDYRFYVKAVDAAGNRSAGSSTITVTTGAPGIAVDNTAAVFTGTWNPNPSSFAPGYYGTNYRHTTSSTEATAFATWTPDLPQDGEYNVYYWLPDGSPGRATNAPFTVHYDGGSHTYTVNEEVKGGEWKLLGRHRFKAGTSGYVTLTNQANNSVIIADAVKFNLISTSSAPEDVAATLSGSSEVLSGQPFRLDYNLSNVTESVYSSVYSQNLTLHYDPALVEFVSVVPTRDGITVAEPDTSVPGQVRLQIDAADPSHPITEAGTILWLYWTTKPDAGDRSSAITLVRAALENGKGETIEAGGAVHSLTIRDADRLLGDVTGKNRQPDGRVDFMDLMMLVLHYDATPADPDWDMLQHGDMDGNNRIGIADLGRVARIILQL